MSWSVEEVVARIAAGEPLEAILHTARPPAERRTLQRLAAARTFDREVYEAILAPDAGEEALPFDQVAAHAGVEPVPGREGIYRLGEASRRTSMEDWWREEKLTPPEIPSALARLNVRLAGYYDRSGEELERLYHLVLVDEAAAAELFAELFRQADRRFDLARCQDLLDLLGERLALLSPRLARLREDRHLYLSARAFWSYEYFRTARFIEPRGLRSRVEALLAGEPSRVLELSARGGMGKTMGLRWLIARYCVPEPRRIPCARIDFDLADPVLACRHPWLLLLELASQLDAQLAGAPFAELTGEHGSYTALLRRSHSEEGRSAARALESEERRLSLAASIPRRFSSTLAEAGAGGPVLLVLDTLEEVLLRPNTEPGRLFAALAELHRRCPDVRIVLSGRYPLGRRLSWFNELFPDARGWALEPFDEEEARRYLSEIREIPRREVVAAAVAKAEGLPFKLALFGDLLQASPEIEAAEIEAYEEVDLLYLIERVIERIEERKLRWLLRYGVVPRSLDLDFVREVMAPYLRRAMAGQSEHDAPERDPLPPRVLERGAPFSGDLLPSPDSPLDLEALWEELSRYASASSWVSADPLDRCALVFHGDVLEPMRRLLRHHRKLCDELHRSAAAYFEARADAEPERWTRWMREAVFHRFQMAGAAAFPYWREVLARAQQRGGAAARKELAAEILGPEYRDEEGEPRIWRDGSPMLSPSILATAFFEIARACVETARAQRLPGEHALWAEAATAMAEVERLGEAAAAALPVVDRARVTAALRAAADEPQGAAAELRAALEDATEAGDRLVLTIDLADLLSRLGEAEAADLYGRALDLVEEVGEAGRAPVLQARLARELTAQGRLVEAMEVCDRALAGAGPGVSLPAGLLLTRADLSLRVCEAAAAGERLAALEGAPLDPDERFRCEWLRARAELISLRPLAALAHSQEAFEAAKGGGEDGRLLRQAAARELRGTVLGELLDLRGALEELERASFAWRKVGAARAASICHARMAELQLRQAGNLRQADQVLREVEKRERPAPGSRVWLTVCLLRLELLHRQGDKAAAAELASALLRELGPRRAPSARAEAALLGLALGTGGEPESLLHLLVENLRQIEPRGARLALLGRHLHLCPVLTGVPQRLLEKLERLVALPGTPTAAGLHPRDFALQSLAVAEVHRVTGDGKGAELHLRRAFEELVSGGHGTGLRLWCQAALRLGRSDLGRRATAARLRTFGEELADYPLLCGATWIEQAARRLADGQHREANRLLKEARRFLRQGKRLETAWNARAEALRGWAAWEAGKAQEAEYRLRQAIRWYRELGDLREADTLRARFREWAEAAAAEGGEEPGMSEPGDRPGGDQPGPRPHQALDGAGEGAGTPAGEGDVASLTVRLVSGGVLEVEAVGVEAASAARGPDGPQPVAELLAALTPPSHELFGYGLVERLAEDPEGLGEGLASLLLADPVAASLAGGEISELRLAVVSPELQPIPWEIADLGRRLPVPAAGRVTLHRIGSEERSAGEEVRHAQIALNHLADAGLAVDGLPGPHTREALAAFQRRRHLPATGDLDRETRDWLRAELVTAATAPPRVLLVRPGLRRQERSNREMAYRETDPLGFYKRHGFDLEVLEDPTFDELEARLAAASRRREPLALIHLCSGLRDTGLDVYLDFAASEGEEISSLGGELGALTPKGLGHLLQLFPREKLSPLVLLDALWTPGRSERARQLLLRNAFASQLFELAAGAAVLATGLTDPEGRAPLYESLMESLAGGRSLAEVAALLRHQVSDSGDRLPFAATALFAHGAFLGIRRPGG